VKYDLFFASNIQIEKKNIYFRLMINACP